MTLPDWHSYGWLVPHLTSHQEVVDLLAVADRDLTAAQSPDLPADWCLNIAYRAAMQVAVAALAAPGYRAEREAHHYPVLQSLQLTIGLDTARVERLEFFRKKRNLSTYRRSGLVSEQEAMEMLSLARDLRQEVETWLRMHHPSLL